MKWTQPPISKIYEAIGAVADGRVEVDGNTAKVYSSSRKKYYDVFYDPSKKAIMTNDNGSFWKEGHKDIVDAAKILKSGYSWYQLEPTEIYLIDEAGHGCGRVLCDFK